MQCSIGALYIIILFFEIRNYIKFKFYIIAGKKRPPQLRKSGRLFPQLARCGLFFVRCPFAPLALSNAQQSSLYKTGRFIQLQLPLRTGQNFAKTVSLSTAAPRCPKAVCAARAASATRRAAKARCTSFPAAFVAVVRCALIQRQQQTTAGYQTLLSSPCEKFL